MNGWLDRWMTNLSFKKGNKHARMYAYLYRMIMNKEKEKKITLKKKTSQNKQKIPLTL